MHGILQDYYLLDRLATGLVIMQKDNLTKLLAESLRLHEASNSFAHELLINCYCISKPV